MSIKRRSYEPATRRSSWWSIDDTRNATAPSISPAAARCARRRSVLMLRVIETAGPQSAMAGVADIMRAEAHEEANAVLDRARRARHPASPASCPSG
jgi:hypothetical protein